MTVRDSEDTNIRSVAPAPSKCVLPAMSVLPQPPSDVVPVVADAMVLSTEVRMGLARRM
jgi:hypothetical protein